MLNGYSPQLAKRKAPPAAEKTEKSKGALIPRAPVIVTANSRSKTPLKRAILRVCHPSTSRMPKRVSAKVATMARAGTAASGKNQLSFPVYATNLAKVPQPTLGSPNAPHSPNRSATADKKEKPRAKRRNKELKANRIVQPAYLFCAMRVTQCD